MIRNLFLITFVSRIQTFVDDTRSDLFSRHMCTIRSHLSLVSCVVDKSWGNAVKQSDTEGEVLAVPCVSPTCRAALCTG